MLKLICLNKQFGQEYVGMASEKMQLEIQTYLLPNVLGRKCLTMYNFFTLSRLTLSRVERVKVILSTDLMTESLKDTPP